MVRRVAENFEQQKKVHSAIIKIVAGMSLVMILPAVLIIGVIVSNGKPLEVGKKAPEFGLLDQNNNYVKNSDYKGDWCLIYFYNGNRPDGLMQARRIKAHYDELHKLHLRLVGISYESVPEHHDFAEQLHLTHDLLSDPEGNVISEYSAHTSMNQMAKNIGYLLDQQGIIKKVYLELEPESQLLAVEKDMRELASL
ncbi:peroxiredoxin Q/BCP [Mariprofundus micogutta]|uniref:thioredoxin-dependent peroxiredoxin n=1 Tax=Mariprofundus micogutta TaxID=1921010 RepID=A0A1L8CLS2_9PROT|nr:redoxin domain-containing protein [Mariprofundus micogutta]GAV19851.1 peroxiredoxin Q/BCP [Mariprofundus micogutta]